MTNLTPQSSNNPKKKEKNLQEKIFKFFDDKKYDTDLQEVKKEHRKEYFKQKQEEYKKKWRKIVLRFSYEELEQIDTIAQNHNLKRATFLKKCVFAYINDVFILPNDKQVNILENSINKIQQNINESIRYVHLNQNISREDLEVIKQQIHRLELVVSKSFRTPPNLHLWLLDQINQDHRFIVRLQEILNQIKHDN